MKIDSASYSLAASHLANMRDESSDSLHAWTGNHRPDFEAGERTSGSTVSLSSVALASLAADIQAAIAARPAPQAIPPAAASGSTAIEEETAHAVDNDPRFLLIKLMVEMLTGHSIRTISAKELQRIGSTPAIPDPNASAPAVPLQAASTQPAGFGIEYDYHAAHQEYEQTLVSAEGSIRTNDGKEISFTLDLSMTRSYREETSVSFRAGDAVRRDPLVLNFNGTAAQLSDQRFAFDLDADGKTETLALLASGSGYLAIDRNGNGRIDSGSELFGPTTDSGFGELSALDIDRNGWIDESDPVLQELRIWTPHSQNDGSLETLAQRKVGAIALGHVASPFELRGAGNSNLGAIAASGIFLTDDGTVGTVQEIDLSV